MVMVLYGLSECVYNYTHIETSICGLHYTPTPTHLEMEVLCIASLLMQVTLSYIKL